MSELKAFDVGLGRNLENGSPCVIAFDADRNPRLLDEEVYLKSEVDKVIAELKAQKAQAEDDCAYWKMNERNAANAMHETEEYAMQLYNESRHQKYKRCLAMADYCFARSVAEDVLHTNRDGIEHSDYWLCRHKMWLELAEKFKEAK